MNEFSMLFHAAMNKSIFFGVYVCKQGMAEKPLSSKKNMIFGW